MTLKKKIIRRKKEEGRKLYILLFFFLHKIVMANFQTYIDTFKPVVGPNIFHPTIVLVLPMMSQELQNEDPYIYIMNMFCFFCGGQFFILSDKIYAQQLQF